MPSAWLRFLIFLFPVAMAGFLLVVELAAFLLQNTAPLRHPLDRLVLSMTHDTPDADFVLMGDSVTQDVAGSYRIDGVANLTTNKASGIVGAYFLLQRYLAENEVPKAVLLASTPEFIGFIPEGATADVYLATVFEREAEQALLAELGIASSGEFWMPAILSIDADVIDPLIGWAFARPKPLTGLGGPIVPGLAVEEAGGNAVSMESVAARADAVPSMSAAAMAILARICDLASTHDVVLHIAWAPMPATVAETWRRGGVLEALEGDVQGAGDGACQAVRFGDLNESAEYPDHAFRDPDHLRRPGWTNRYAGELARYFGALSR